MTYGTNGPSQPPPPGGWYPPPAGTGMPPGYGYPGYGYPPPPPPPPASNTLAVAGFVCSLIGILLAFVPVVGVGAWVLIVVGLVLASIGLARASQGGRRGLAIAGVVLGVVAVPICVITTVAALAAGPWTRTTPEASAPVTSAPYAPYSATTPSYSADTGSSGTAHMATDQIYIGALRAGGIPFSTEDDAIAAAHSTCTMFAQGATIAQQVEQSTDAGYTEYQSGYILGAAVSAYCPEYKSLLHIDN